MANDRNKIEFVVIKKEYSFEKCRLCNGAGRLTIKREGIRHESECRKCEGSGFVRIEKAIEFSLLDALRDLELIK